MLAQRHIIERKHVVVLTDSGAIPSLYVRLMDPLVRLTANYNIVHSWHAGAERLAASADLLVVQRWFNAPVWRAAEAARNNGVPIIYETDDNLLDLSENSSNMFSDEQRVGMIALMGMADVMVCSTESLAEWARQYTNRIVVLRNYGLIKPILPMAERPHLAVVNTDYFKLSGSKTAFFDALATAVVDLGYRISFFGSVDPAMRAMLIRHPDSISIAEDFIDDRSTFLDRLAAVGVNVAAVPLEETRQHRFKSDIKFLDYASIGVPGIFNNREVYADVHHDEDGFLCEDTFEGWLAGLRYFASLDHRRRCGAAARQVVAAGRSLDHYAEAMGDLYANLLEIDGHARTDINFAALPSAEEAVDRPALFWMDGNLQLLAGRQTHHIKSAALIPRMLSSGIGMLDRELGLAERAVVGEPLSTEADLQVLLAKPPSADGPMLRPDRGRPLRIAWILPRLLIGGGGHRNIIRCAYQLERLGHQLSLYFTDTPESGPQVAADVRQHFYPLRGHIDLVTAYDGGSDILFATHWSTMRHAEQFSSRVGEIIYFVQDFEPHFYAMGSEYVLAENTYRRGHYAITSGLWCEQFLRQSFGAEADHFRFPIDSDVYNLAGQEKRANRVIFFAKPEMPRRCYELGVEALTAFHALRPNVEIAFYGSGERGWHMPPFPVTQLGLLPDTAALARLYRESSLGVVFSTTNPSLVPYEMMACGLPVVDLGRPGNSLNYGGREDIAFLADPNPAAMGGQIAALMDDTDDRAARAESGVAFSASFPREEEVGQRIEALIYSRVTAWSQVLKDRFAL